MDKELEIRIKKLEKDLDILSNQLNKALIYIDDDPHSSLTKSRTILEQILLNIYKLEMDQDPKKFEIGAILTDNQFTRKIDRRIVSRMNAIRDMSNLGVHGENVSPGDAKIVLDNLCEVLEWYFENYRTVKPEPAFQSNVYELWKKSLGNGLLNIELDTKDYMKVESLSNILYEIMLSKEFSETDSRNSQISLIELLNNVKFHVKESSVAGIQISFEQKGYRKNSIRIEVQDSGPGFHLDKSITDNERKLDEGGREHGLLRAFRLGSDISQESGKVNRVIWSKIQTPLIANRHFQGNQEYIFIGYNFKYIDEININGTYFSYRDFVKLVTKFSGNLLSNDYRFKLTNALKITLDYLKKDTRELVVLAFEADHSTMVIRAEEADNYPEAKGDLEPPVPTLSHIIYNFINEVTPKKQLVIFNGTGMIEDDMFLKEFCKERYLIYLDSHQLYHEFIMDPYKRLRKEKFRNFFGGKTRK
jgi:hypothetical protein